jgi:proline iminopeptidase
MNKTRKNNKNNKNKTLKKNKPHYLTVSDIHKIAYYTYGNKNNEPIFVIHGGPGGRSKIKMLNFFNLKKYFVVFIDQRGCGKSKPFGELKDNNTSNLIHDIERIRTHLNLNKINIVGFSWGSYLSLSYSVKYPQNIKKIVVGGVYLCKKEEYNDFERGDLLKKIYPDVFDELGVANFKRTDKHILNNLLRELYTNKLTPDNKKLNKLTKNDKLETILYMHYIENNCFSRDLLNKIDKIKDIPVIIIQGRYDIVTPAYYAYELHKKLPKSKIYFTTSGHKMEKEDKDLLLKIFKKL